MPDGVPEFLHVRGSQYSRGSSRKPRYFDRFRTEFNPAQQKVIDRMFDAGPSGFQGGMTASKYSRLARVSKATATRHLVDLAQKSALVSEGQGKTTRYQIRLEPKPRSIHECGLDHGLDLLPDGPRQHITSRDNA